MASESENSEMESHEEMEDGSEDESPPNDDIYTGNEVE